MPIFWWYLLRNYLKVLFLAVVSFISILLVTQLEEIAQFATIGAKPLYIFLFTLYQTIYILPIAIPIACLLSALILFQRLSQTGELTALRAGGLSLNSITSPILIAGAFLALGTFYITSEMATSSHLATRKMIYDLTSVNPLILLQSAKIARLKTAFVQMDPIRNGEEAADLVIALNNPSGKGLSLYLAKQVEMSGKQLVGTQVSLITSVPSEKERDHLVIENQQSMFSEAPQLASMLRKTGWKIANDHLKFSLLRARMADVRADTSGKGGRILNKCQTEIARRSSMGLSAFSFTLMGVAFGMGIGRHFSIRGVGSILILTALALISFCVAKELDHLYLLASTLFLAPHVLITTASLWTMHRISKGIE